MNTSPDVGLTMRGISSELGVPEDIRRMNIGFFHQWIRLRLQQIVLNILLKLPIGRPYQNTLLRPDTTNPSAIWDIMGESVVLAEPQCTMGRRESLVFNHWDPEWQLRSRSGRTKSEESAILEESWHHGALGEPWRCASTRGMGNM